MTSSLRRSSARDGHRQAVLVDEDGDDEIDVGMLTKCPTLGGEGLAGADVPCVGMLAKFDRGLQAADRGGVLRARLEVRANEVGSQNRFTVRHGAVGNRGPRRMFSAEACGAPPSTLRS